MMKWKLVVPAFATALLCCVSCNHSKNKKGVEAAMQTYDRYILHMDMDSIALLYTPDGDLGQVAHGRDSIRKFLGSFKNIRVLSQVSVSKSIDFSGDSALQKGTYKQVALIAGKDTVTVKGEYTSLWLWLNSEGWKIRRMETKSTAN